MGAIELAICAAEEEGYPGKDARAELAEKDAETEELRRLLGVQIAVHAAEGRELAEKNAQIERLTAALAVYEGVRCPDCQDGEMWNGEALVSCPKCGGSAFVPAPTTAKLVPVERLKQLAERPGEGRSGAAGCCWCHFDWWDGHAPDCWPAALLREETVPPKPTPPPLRVFREGDIPKKADRAS